MARTRQKSKQRKAKRLEQEQRATGRSPAPDSGDAVDEAIEQGSAPLEGDSAPAEVEAVTADVAPADAAPARRSRGRMAAPERTAAPDKPRQAKAPAKAPAKKERGRAKPAEKQPRQRNRVLGFFRNVWAELRRVQWPDRSQVTQATAVVVAFTFIAGFYLAAWDYVFNKLVKALL